jgi:hypothetical protein
MLGRCGPAVVEEKAMKPVSLRRSIVAAAAALAALGAHADPVTLTKLTGLAGSAPAAATAIYKADLSRLSGSFAAISIGDNSSGLGGSPGQFSGFDLDAIKLSTTNCADAACASGAVGLSLFNFVSGVFFTPGTQRAPGDAKLFGTGPGGNTVNNTVATLGLFDGVATTDASANGFISLGDTGSIAFNLKRPHFADRALPLHRRGRRQRRGRGLEHPGAAEPGARARDLRLAARRPRPARLGRPAPAPGAALTAPAQAPRPA